MNNIENIFNEELNESMYSTTLKNGLKVFICKKQGFQNKIGMFGTIYGSVDNHFVDIKTNKEVKVPDGVAHFLEHKLFEQEELNALDLFSKLGVSANAYTSFDHTVYFFETIEKFEQAMELLIKLVKTPYFTTENVEKEKGIIAQEINMYRDESNYVGYFNTLIGMYKKNPVRIDIAGTVESISKIDKDILFTCYNTFYNPANMFVIVVGDVDVEDTVKLIEDNIKIYETNYGNEAKKEIKKIIDDEPNEINKKLIEQKMQVYMPILNIGYKLKLAKKEELLKREIVCDIISDMYFSKLSNFYETQYNEGILNEPVSFYCENSTTFSHIMLSATSTKMDKLTKNIDKYLSEIKNSPVDEELFSIIKNKKIGNAILRADNIDEGYRRIIESILTNTQVYKDIEILKSIEIEDIMDIFKLLDNKIKVVSIIKEK